ncbi:MAG: glycerol-3-phosphate 1-O-acyltransferase PlsY [Ruminococcus sp.]|nr:glycerol-3-phosphate 1-O-acyltransferase PlsY [Ruminococcus sp.]
MSVGFYICCGVFAVIAFLMGGINGAIMLSKLIYKQDIRTLGSGNPGFTNFKRVYGLNAAAWVVMVFDIVKAMIPVCTAMIVFGNAFGCGQFGAAFTGLFCMLGHCFPVWYGFKGGKAFMTGFGTIWFVDWRMALIAMALFLTILFTVKIMSISSCIASAACPITLAILGTESYYVLIVSALSALLVIVRHYENFKKLLNGTESKFTLHSKKTETEKAPTE